MHHGSIRNAFFSFVLALTISFPAIAVEAPLQSPSRGSNPIPQPAINAILNAFSRYEIVAMPVAHGQKDLDDFILDLIRDPRFPRVVNDIAVECGNSLYQPILDRYIAGQDVPIQDVRKVWRNTTQPPCGVNAFYESFFPLIRALNQKLPNNQRLRVLAADSPIDWDKIKTPQDFQSALRTVRRDNSISRVMEKEVLAKHRKALMLFGEFHLFHINAGFQKDYPNATFVVSTLGMFDTHVQALASSPFAGWPIPSLALAKGTWLGALDLTHFYPPPLLLDNNCEPHLGFPKRLQKPMEALVDAFLYLGPQDLLLWQKTPADVVLDTAYMKEWRRRLELSGDDSDLHEFDQQIIDRASNPLMTNEAKAPDENDIKQAVKACLDLKTRSKSPQ